MSKSPPPKDPVAVQIPPWEGRTTLTLGLSPKQTATMVQGPPVTLLSQTLPSPFLPPPEKQLARDVSEMELRWLLRNEIADLKRQMAEPCGETAKRLTLLTSAAKETADEDGLAIAFCAVIVGGGLPDKAVTGTLSLDQCLETSMLGHAAEAARRTLQTNMTGRVMAAVESIIRGRAKAGQPAPSSGFAAPAVIRPGEGILMPGEGDEAPGG